ncbi:MAG TPA: alpha-amylase family glycosyl hydrolase [Gammaproteobacteria bacterium]
MASDLEWWQRAVIYQLVVPSFKDSNGDGIGDLRGVIAELDYLEWLGVDAVWLSPIYPTPLRDLGYDVSHFTDVDPRFGTLATFDELLAAAHRRGIAVILDWVPNHTSDEHPWFVESRASRRNGRRAWYLWRDAKSDGSPPSNWISVFGGSAWEWHAPTGQYYLHTFHRTQPDLNWRNPEVQEAMLGTLRFWLDRGVDGFRVDACCLLFKDPEFRDNPANPDYRPGDGPDSTLLPVHTRDQPGLHEALARIRALTDSYPGERVLLGELYLPLAKVMAFYGGARPELHLPLHMSLSWTPWDADALATALEDHQGAVPPGGWPGTTLSTHDAPRIAARAGSAQTRLAAMLLETLRGTITHYYGEEIGMHGVPLPAKSARDPQGRRTGRTRDPERTPMQWDDSPNAGFTSGTPWLPVGADYVAHNVRTQREDPGSLLALYRRLIALRRQEPALIGGAFERMPCDPPLLAFRRRAGSQVFLVALNLGTEPIDYPLERASGGHIVLSTLLDREGERCTRRIALRGCEGVILATG